MQATTAVETRSDQAAAGQGAPGSAQRTWSAVVAAWLAAQASPHTRRHYATSWTAFAQFMGDDFDPLRITSDDVNA